MAMVDAGAVAIAGNHDVAVCNSSETMNAVAQAAIAWTRGRLAPSHRAFLSALPMTADNGDCLYVHASASAPDTWIYVLGPREAFQSFRACSHRLTFCGHTHIPALFNESATTLPHQHVPVEGKMMPLLQQRRWLAVLGAVGQPRDNNPAACYGLFDTVRSGLCYVRVPYDVELAARKIRAAGLPHVLAKRLLTGS
jgi:diadenosine tetraphosphatase ApaH/serine/threonine PP2A family protein phosphatase